MVSQRDKVAVHIIIKDVELNRLFEQFVQEISGIAHFVADSIHHGIHRMIGTGFLWRCTCQVSFVKGFRA